MKTVNATFLAALQSDTPLICEIITLGTVQGDYHWTTANQPVVSSGTTYDPLPGGSSSGLEDNLSLVIGNINFTIANTGDLQGIIPANGLDASSLYIRRVLTNSPDLDALPLFRGNMGDFAYTRAAISGTARTMMQKAKPQWPTYTYMDTCVWRFGSTGCGYNVTSSTVNSLGVNVGSSTAIALIAGSGSLVGSYAPGQLERGRVTVITGPNSGQVRSVRISSGDYIGLSHSLPYAPQSGDAFSIYPGCRKRFLDDCTSKYNNAHRFLGFPWMPRQEQAF